MTSVSAQYYDGNNTRRHAVTLTFAQGWLQVRGEEISRDESLNTASISEKLGSAPRLIHFNDGAHCEISDHASLETLLTEAGHQPLSLVSRMESHWRVALASLLLLLAGAVAAYLWGLPRVAELAAQRIPYSTAHQIDEQALQTFDHGLMQPSKLPITRQQQLQQEFEKLRRGYSLPEYPLQFRASPEIGANAFALPGGTIVITDEIILLAKSDEEILAVLAHELGHVSERHALRNLLQGSIVALALTWYVGDISNLLATAPTLLLQARYTRNFERSADAFAAHMLQAKGMDAAKLATLLDRLETSHRGKNRKGSKLDEWLELLSSHPATEERVKNIRQIKPE